MIDFESQLLARATAAGTGNPHRQLATVRNEPERSMKVRVLVDGWYSGAPDSHPVKVGETLTLPTSTAMDLQARGKVTIAK